MVRPKDAANSSLELGKLYFDRCDCITAIEHIKVARSEFLERKDFSSYLKCQNLLLRIYGEMEDFNNINLLKESLQDLVINEGVELNSKTYYTLGVCACYKNQPEVGLDYFQKALTLALADDLKEDICYAISGIANVYFILEKYPLALKEIYNLQVFFQVLPHNELTLATQILNARVLSHMERYDQALEIFWECYDKLKSEKNLRLLVHTLWGIGVTCHLSGDQHMAKVYLQLAARLIDPSNMVNLSKEVGNALRELGVADGQDYDLVLKETTNSVVEKKKGPVDFKNQFILLDLLKLFMFHPGTIFSKETLVKKIWNQEYSPEVHDNKVYVTIKRLRKMIEPDFDKPKYIFRAKDGYYLNKNNRIFVEPHDKGALQ